MENLIPIPVLCAHYEVKLSFFTTLSDMGLLQIKTINNNQYIDYDAIYEIERMIRMHQELDVNMEGIDIIFNLLEKIDALQNELTTVKNTLRLYES